MVKKFLLIQTAFLGDVILMTPLIKELNRLYPQAQMDVLVRKGNESLLANNPKIHEVMIWDKKQKKYPHLFQILRKIRKIKYDEVIGIQRFASSGILTGMSKAKSRIGFQNNPFSYLFTRKIPHEFNTGKHEVERNLSLIAHHEGVQNLVRPELFPSPEDEVVVYEYQKQAYYCIAPASVWFTKQMTQDKWEELIDFLGKEHTIYLLGSLGDVDLCERLKNAKPDFSIQNLAGKLSLLSSAVLMRDAKRNYVNDSGPLHIASAVNAKVTAYFLSTIPAFGFGPLSEDSQIVETDLNLPCRPCGMHGHKACPEGHFKCNYSIDMKKSLR
jgi:heptosyltransferase-2